MRNVTITLDDKTAAWARTHAASQGKSLSRFLSEILSRSMLETRVYDDAMRQFLAKQAVRLDDSASPYPTRDELHDRDRLR